MNSTLQPQVSDARYGRGRLRRRALSCVLTVLACAGLEAMNTGFEFVRAADSPEAQTQLLPAVNSRLNVEPFAPILVDAVEFEIRTPAEPCIDEFEIYAADGPKENVARDARIQLTSSGDFPGFAIHQLEHIRDGQPGNDRSWLATQVERAWVRFTFPVARQIERVVWGRDRTGKHTDRTAVRYTLRARTPSGEWRELSSERRHRPGLEFQRPPGLPWLVGATNAESQTTFSTLNTRTWIAPDRPIRITRWQAEDGLPSQTLLSLAQTPDGFLWLATARGLVRFDGRTFTTLPRREHPALPPGQILQIEPMPDGDLWVRSESGKIARIHDHAVLPAGEGSPEDAVRLMQSHGKPVALDGKRDLHVLDQGRWKRLPNTYTTLVDSHRSPSVDPQGQGWLITGQHELAQITDQGLKQVPLPAPLNSGHLLETFSWPGKGLVVTHDSQRAALIKSDGSIVFPIRTHALGSNPGRKPVLFDQHQRLWLGSYGGGLIQVLEDGRTAHAPLGEDPEREAITGLLEDPQGCIWVATASSGLFRLAPDNFVHPAWLPRIPTTPVHSIAHGSTGTWIASDSYGVFHVNNRDGNLMQLQLNQAYAWSLVETAPGRLWIGTYGGGLIELNLQDPSRYWNRLPGVVTALLSDGNGGVWAGGELFGLHHFTDRTSESWIDAEAGPISGIRALARDGTNAEVLWVGSRTSGLQRFQNGRFTRIEPSAPDESLRVLALHSDPDGTLWIGTEGQGLFVLRSGRFHHVTVGQGLPSDWIHAIRTQDPNTLWLTSPAGVTVVKRPDAMAVAEGHLAKLPGRTLGRAEGLPAVECTSGSQPLVAFDSQGRFWASTHRGPAIVDSAVLRQRQAQPGLAIERILCDGRRILPRISPSDQPRQGPLTQSHASRNASVTLAPGEHRLEVEYAVIDTGPGGLVRCRYRMGGLETDWTDDGLRRRADYTHLPPGRYRFELQSALEAGEGFGPSLALRVIVQPTLLQMPAVRGTLAGGVALLLFFIYRQRVRGLEKQRQAQQEFGRRLIASQEAERKRIAAEIHDSLEQTLLVIKNQVSLALRQLPTSAPPPPALRQIFDSAGDAISEVRAIAANLRPYQIDRLGITKAISAMIRTLSESSTIRFSIEIETIDGHLTPEAEINLYRILQESLNNVVRHSEASECQITLGIKDGREVLLLVADNGKGFAVSSQPKPAHEEGGWGITGLVERARMMGGITVIDSSPGTGTRITVTLPIAGHPSTSASLS